VTDQPGPAAPPRLTLAGVPIDACTGGEAVRLIVDHATRAGPPAYVVTPNAMHVVMLQEMESFRRVYDEAWLSLADGMAVVWACSVLGTPVPEKVSGSDLFPALCGAAADAGASVFFMGGRPGAAEGAARVLTARHPALRVAGTYCPPMGFEKDPAENARTLAAVRAAAPDILFVGLGAPKQEFWMHAHHRELGVPVSLGIGVSFEFVAGMVKRAPVWMQRSGLEWFHRLAMEPRRLWKRYAVTNPRFAALVLREYTRGGRPPAPPAPHDVSSPRGQ
jgi:N-acetylglucosaminyldiphosphoundecaprenol N-acetyl-beta-D-mannosaminyltransferase